MKTITLTLNQLALLTIILLTSMSVAAGNVRYVKQTASGTGDGSSWANASSDLHAMLAASISGDSVWVAAGTYYPASIPPGTTTTPTTARDYAFYVPPGVKLYGGFAGNETYISQRNLSLNITILDGDIGTAGDMADNCHHVLIFAVSGSTNVSRADGLTIRNGNANGSGNITISGQTYGTSIGGGIYSILCQRLDLYNLNLTGNRSNARGGGAYISTATLLNLYNSVIGNNLCSSSSADGGGLYIINSNGTLQDNTFRNNNVSSPFAGNGGAIYISSGAFYILNNTFDNNSCSNSGGGIYYTTGRPRICNNVLYGNQASVRGGGLAISTVAEDTVANNTFYGNNAVSGGGAFNSSTNNTRLYNNVFRANMLNGNSNTAGADFTRQSGTVIAKNNLFQLASINYTPTDLGAGAVNNLFQLDPLFTNPGLPAGPDGIDRTADDGFIPVSCSPAVNSGDHTLLPVGINTDILLAARTQLGANDMGAYERSSIIPDANAVITTVALSITKTQSGSVVYANDCNTLAATVSSSGASPVTGTTTARVWIETVQPNRFVKRHYEITPALNASTATGRITLYFTQQEFDDFNTVNTVKLPMDPADGANYKANLLIEKRAGTSSDGSGLPASYSGTVSLIDPADTDITWNATQSRWEVSFDVTGFSGFFVKTTPLPLSVKWISITGMINRLNQAELSWKVEEHFVTHYDIEKSQNGTSFNQIGTLPGQGDGTHTYTFTDPVPLKQGTYYRIRQTDADGRTSYSSTITMQPNQQAAALFVFPNPVKNAVNITSSKIQSARIVDAAGKTTRALQLPAGTLSLNTEGWPKGLYMIITESGESVKLIRD